MNISYNSLLIFLTSVTINSLSYLSKLSRTKVSILGLLNLNMTSNLIQQKNDWRRHSGWCCLPIVLLAIQIPAIAIPEIGVLPKTCEINLALSAAPEHLRAEAAVYVLEQKGYRKLRQGNNSFTCIVNRDHPRVLKPTCFDLEGTETIIPKILFFGRLMMKGVAIEIINDRVQKGFIDGTFISPRRPGVAYMLSRYNRPYNSETDSLGWFAPHIMFYAPDLKLQDIGMSIEAWNENPRLPMIGYQGPHGYMIVMADDGKKRSRSDLSSCPDWVHSD